MVEIKYVVVHGGVSHEDEIAALGLAMMEWGHVPCYRRDPTEEELDDPEIAVLDVGMNYNPEWKNFDHHQLPEGSEDCAFSLLAKCLGYDEVLQKHTRWYESLCVLDSRGPYEWAAKFGFERFPFGLIGPLSIGIKKRFEKYHGTRPVDPTLTRIIMEAIEAAIVEATKIAEALGVIREEARHVIVSGLPGVIYESKSSTGLNEYYDACKEAGLLLAFSVTLDDRGDGWCLYRFGDHPEVDFSRLASEDGVVFFHQSGFIAKTEEAPLQAALDLVSKAVVRKDKGERQTCEGCGCKDVVEGVACPNCD